MLCEIVAEPLKTRSSCKAARQYFLNHANNDAISLALKKTLAKI